MIEVELARLLISEMRPHQMIVLKEKVGSRSFPIFIGYAEAWAIDKGLKGLELARPLTHDLLASVITSLGGEVERVVVCDLREDETTHQGTFYAKLIIRQNASVIEVDSRPSDAIALATQEHVPIFVEEHVLDAVGDDVEELPEGEGPEEEQET